MATLYFCWMKPFKLLSLKTTFLSPDQLVITATIVEYDALVFSAVDPADVGDGEGAVRRVHREAILVHDVQAHPEMATADTGEMLEGLGWYDI